MLPFRIRPMPLAALAVPALLTFSIALLAQPPFGGRGPGGGPGGPGGQGPQTANLPSEPTAVELPSLSGEITGPGPMFDSAPSHAPGYRPEDFNYDTREYFVSGTANDQPYTTRVVVRMPSNPNEFSGLVLAESMHSSGSAHAFEFTAVYTMDSGHAAVEILTTPPAQFAEFNGERYADLRVQNGQANDILAQVGALIKSDRGPLGDVSVRKSVLAGTSMSAGTLINYLPAHRVYRTPSMEHIYDGYLPTSNGSTVPQVDVPVIQIPTMHEVEGNVSARQDGDAPGDQFRIYEFAGMGHVDSRDNVRLLPNPCERPLSTYPLQAYMAVGLHHLMRWVDEDVVPPRADRIHVDRESHRDGSMMALDQHGNPIGGIRSPYVDLPVAKYAPVNTAAQPLPENPSEYVAVNGMQGAQIMCRLSAYQEPLSRTELRALYGSKQDYVQAFRARLEELEREGWSLPVYREIILADALAVSF